MAPSLGSGCPPSSGTPGPAFLPVPRAIVPREYQCIEPKPHERYGLPAPAGVIHIDAEETMKHQTERGAAEPDTRKPLAARTDAPRRPGVVDISGRLRRLSHQRRYTATRMR